jgi:hypothetical protein
MGSTRRTVLTAKHKAVLWFLGLLILWEVLQSNAVLEAFLTFGFAGVIPGTNIVLSPNAVIMVTGITLALVFIAIILGILLKRPKNRVPANLERVAEAVAIEQAGLTPVIPSVATASVPKHIPKPTTPGLLMRTWGRLRAAALPVEQQLLHMSGVVMAWLDQKMPVVGRALHRALQITWALGIIMFVFARKGTIIASRWARKYARLFWQWLVPYLWKFDTWLELRVRAFTKWARFKSRQYHSLTIVISMFRQYKKLYSESPIAAFFGSKRQTPRQEDEV